MMPYFDVEVFRNLKLDTENYKFFSIDSGTNPDYQP